MTETNPPKPALLFRPDAFFLKPWHGWGLVRDGRGRTIDRFECHGEGRSSGRSAISRTTQVMESGEVQVSEWDIISDEEGHYVARDIKTGMEGRGRLMGREFQWVSTPPLPGPLGKFIKGRAVATYSLVSETSAVGVTEVSLFGLTVRTIVMFLQHREA